MPLSEPKELTEGRPTGLEVEEEDEVSTASVGEGAAGTNRDAVWIPPNGPTCS